MSQKLAFFPSLTLRTICLAVQSALKIINLYYSSRNKAIILINDCHLHKIPESQGYNPCDPCNPCEPHNKNFRAFRGFRVTNTPKKHFFALFLHFFSPTDFWCQSVVVILQSKSETDHRNPCFRTQYERQHF